MKCRDIEPLILAERDGVLTTGQHAEIEGHAASCSACRKLRADLHESLALYQADVAKVALPNVDNEWQAVRAQLDRPAKPARKRLLAPVIWFGTSLAAAAALALAYVGLQPGQPQVMSAPMPPETPQIAQADYVEAGDTNASTMVYVDKDSGWLVVWAADGDTKNSG
jgi:predicted anti-sigma-YlaC factor YlaD